jgi:histidine triad (HIT) family protein
MSNTPTIFDRILAGEIPCQRVHEDEHTLAFLDIAPLAPGHTLIIPKQARAHLHELDDEYAAAIGRVLPRIARAVLAASGAEAYNVLQNNGAGAHQAVFHVHFHIIPKLGKQGLGIGWVPGRLDNDQAARMLAAMHASLHAAPSQPA